MSNRLGLCLPGFVFSCSSILPSPGDLSDVLEGERQEGVPVSGKVFRFVVLCRRLIWLLTSNILMDVVVCVGKRWGLEGGARPSGFRIASALDLRVRISFFPISAGRG